MDGKKESRRSSILKPQKPRTPLASLDFTGDLTGSDEACTFPAVRSRRVSFANANLVKQFAADPDKNTIWDSTYEEVADHTESTGSSTHLQATTNGATSELSNTTSNYNENMLTEHIVSKGCEKCIVLKNENTKSHTEVATEACVTSTNLKIGVLRQIEMATVNQKQLIHPVIDKENIIKQLWQNSPIVESTLISNDNKTKNKPLPKQVTTEKDNCQDGDKFSIVNYIKMREARASEVPFSVEQCPLERIAPTKVQNNFSKNSVETCKGAIQKPVLKRNFQRPESVHAQNILDEMVSPKVIKKPKLHLLEIDSSALQYTQMISSDLEIQNSKVLNATKIMDESMEFTTKIPNLRKNENQVLEAKALNCTQISNKSLELTEQFFHFKIVSGDPLQSIKDSSVNSTKIVNDDMEFTHVIPNFKAESNLNSSKVLNESVDLTCNFANSNKLLTKQHKTIYNTDIEITTALTIDSAEMTVEDMEFTVAIQNPKLMQQNLHLEPDNSHICPQVKQQTASMQHNKTIFDSDIDLTSVGIVDSTKITGEDMEFTVAIENPKLIALQNLHTQLQTTTKQHQKTIFDTDIDLKTVEIVDSPEMTEKDMEFTIAIQNPELESQNLQLEPQSLHRRPQELKDDQQILNPTKNQPNKTIFDTDIDLTVGIVNSTKMIDDDMEFTAAIQNTKLISQNLQEEPQNVYVCPQESKGERQMQIANPNCVTNNKSPQCLSPNNELQFSNFRIDHKPQKERTENFKIAPEIDKLVPQGNGIVPHNKENLHLGNGIHSHGNELYNVEICYQDGEIETPHTSMHSDSMNFSQCLDDTEHLVHAEIGSKRTSKSEFSKIISGDYVPDRLSSRFFPLGKSSDSFALNLDQTHKSDGNTTSKSISQSLNKELEDQKVLRSTNKHPNNSRMENVFNRQDALMKDESLMDEVVSKFQENSQPGISSFKNGPEILEVSKNQDVFTLQNMTSKSYISGPQNISSMIDVSKVEGESRPQELTNLQDTSRGHAALRQEISSIHTSKFHELSKQQDVSKVQGDSIHHLSRLPDISKFHEVSEQQNVSTRKEKRVCRLQDVSRVQDISRLQLPKENEVSKLQNISNIQDVSMQEEDPNKNVSNKQSCSYLQDIHGFQEKSRQEYVCKLQDVSTQQEFGRLQDTLKSVTQHKLKGILIEDASMLQNVSKTHDVSGMQVISVEQDDYRIPDNKIAAVSGIQDDISGKQKVSTIQGVAVVQDASMMQVDSRLQNSPIVVVSLVQDDKKKDYFTSLQEVSNQEESIRTDTATSLNQVLVQPDIGSSRQHVSNLQRQTLEDVLRQSVSMNISEQKEVSTLQKVLKQQELDHLVSMKTKNDSQEIFSTLSILNNKSYIPLDDETANILSDTLNKTDSFDQITFDAHKVALETSRSYGRFEKDSSSWRKSTQSQHCSTDPTNCDVSNYKRLSKNSSLLGKGSELSNLIEQIFSKQNQKKMSINKTLAKLKEECTKARKSFQCDDFSKLEVNQNGITGLIEKIETSVAKCILPEPIQAHIIGDTPFSSNEAKIENTNQVQTLVAQGFKLQEFEVQVCAVQEQKHLKDQIVELQRGCDGFWTISSLDNFVFLTYFGAIQIQVFVNEATGIVHDLQVANKLGEGTEPTVHFVHSICMRKFENAALFKSLGEKYTILSLLDYISITMQCILDYNVELMKLRGKYLFEMSYDYSASFQVHSLLLNYVWKISVDLSNLNNITADSISVKAIAGIVNETKIKNCSASCPRGFEFINSFITNVQLYLEALEKQRHIKHVKPI